MCLQTLDRNYAYHFSISENRIAEILSPYQQTYNILYVSETDDCGWIFATFLAFTNAFNIAQWNFTVKNEDLRRDSSLNIFKI